MDLYNSLDDKYLVLKALRHGSQFNLQTTPCLPLAFVHIHQMAPPLTVVTTSSCSLLLIYRPRKDKRLSWPSWLTYSGWFTDISGHPSAVWSSAGQRKLAGQRPTFYCCLVSVCSQELREGGEGCPPKFVELSKGNHIESLNFGVGPIPDAGPQSLSLFP